MGNPRCQDVSPSAVAKFTTKKGGVRREESDGNLVPFLEGTKRLGRGVEIKSAGHDSVEFTINPQIIHILRIRRRVIRSRLMHYILF